MMRVDEFLLDVLLTEHSRILGFSKEMHMKVD